MKRILIGTVASMLLGMMVACAGGKGADGTDGTDGTNGSTGPAGPQGPAGADGSDGATGATGATGAQGPAGVPPAAAISIVAEPNNVGVNAGVMVAGNPTYVNIVETGSGATAGLGTFTKVNDSTTIIATYNGHISANPTLAAGTICVFQVRVDGAAGTGLGKGPNLTAFGPQSNQVIPGSFSAAFNGLAAGTHTLQLFASCQGATEQIVPNGGGFGENAQVLEI